MRSVLITFVICGLLVGLASPSSPQDIPQKKSEELAEIAKETAVYIQASYLDPNTQDVKPGEVGTGFIISKNGYVLTAYHVIKDWELQSPEQKQAHPLVAAIGSKFSSQVNIDFVDKDTLTDIAILHIRGQPDLPSATVCLMNEGLQPGAPIFGYGYANNTDLTPSTGSFSNANGDGGTWLGSANFAHGMSGGPVYNAYGEVVGLIRGKIDFQDATNFITPIRRAKRIVDPVTAWIEQCAAESDSGDDGDVDPKPVNPLEGTDVVYFEKSADGGRVRQVLAQNTIPVDLRDSTEGGASNWIHCGEDVPVEHLKKLARLLLDGGIGIVGISPSMYTELPHRLTIETINVSTPRATLSSSDIDNLDACARVSGDVDFSTIEEEWVGRSIWKASGNFCSELLDFWDAAENLAGLHYRSSGKLVTLENFESGRLNESFAIDQSPSTPPRCFTSSNVVYCRKIVGTSTDVFSRVYRRSLDQMQSCIEGVGGQLTNTGKCSVGDATGLACTDLERPATKYRCGCTRVGITMSI
ncbi:hypothetical protein ATY75_13325 [Rhizobium sp. N122]|uniref:S1 family peptidase n=1 Tax=Rhizobium sp. N122 TaxID=1764272 RepID=UPI000B697177|nr:serine protease [Rhizobium sp. N122]OWV61411.1 hypothetical protein ATY75_13325 [Rhizobium sp. N122]